jgi:hypothetical protein
MVRFPSVPQNLNSGAQAYRKLGPGTCSLFRVDHKHTNGLRGNMVSFYSTPNHLEHCHFCPCYIDQVNEVEKYVPTPVIGTSKVHDKGCKCIILGQRGSRNWEQLSKLLQDIAMKTSHTWVCTFEAWLEKTAILVSYNFHENAFSLP